MNEEQIRKILEDSYDDSRENTLLSMVKDFYNRKMLSMVIFLWTMGLIFIIGAVVSGVLFFRDGQTKYQILYATLFICFMLFLSMIKIFAWQMIHKNSLKREIKRLELRIAELTQAVKEK